MTTFVSARKWLAIVMTVLNILVQVSSVLAILEVIDFGAEFKHEYAAIKDKLRPLDPDANKTTSSKLVFTSLAGVFVLLEFLGLFGLIGGHFWLVFAYAVVLLIITVTDIIQFILFHRTWFWLVAIAWSLTISFVVLLCMRDLYQRGRSGQRTKCDSVKQTNKRCSQASVLNSNNTKCNDKRAGIDNDGSSVSNSFTKL